MLNLRRFSLRKNILGSVSARVFALSSIVTASIAIPSSARAEQPESPAPIQSEVLNDGSPQVASSTLPETADGPPGMENEMPPYFSSFTVNRVGNIVHVYGQVVSATGGDTVEFGGNTSGSTVVDGQGNFTHTFNYPGYSGVVSAVATDLNGEESETVIEIF